MNAPVRLAVLASGSGSNFEAICDYFAAKGEAAAVQPVLLASNRANALALTKARERHIATAVLSNPADGDELSALLEQHKVDLVALAGYLKLLPVDVVRRYEGRILNVHPSLLPRFGGKGMYGLRVHEAVLSAGSDITGASVHVVTEEYDRGPVLAVWPAPVLPGDTPASLAKRVLAVEHALYPRVIERVASGSVTAVRPWYPQREDVFPVGSMWRVAEGES
jgi:formyltetrahydrofolate-dependent phosphoribosylglycinamide formyltransferase